MSKIKKIKYSVGDFRLDVDEWVIPQKGITGLIGASGSGKSTLFRILMGLEPLQGFVWEHEGTDLAALPSGQRRLGVVFQNYELFPHMTALENVRFAAEAGGLSKADQVSESQRLLKRLGLEAAENRKARVLSGGEKQRVALARALVCKPRFLLLDEPYSALDQALRAEARKLVAELVHEFNVPTILITHDPLDLAEAAATFRLKDGKIAPQGP